MGDMEKWNYAVGFGLFFLGLLLAAHPSTPLGRGRGVVVGMLACFLLGLLWICTSTCSPATTCPRSPVFNDLDQWNLVVGIGFMAVGFSLRHPLGMSPVGSALGRTDLRGHDASVSPIGPRHSSPTVTCGDHTV